MAIRGLGARPGRAPQEGAQGLYALVVVDKFTKWIEARPITMIKSEQAVLFFTDIIH